MNNELLVKRAIKGDAVAFLQLSEHYQSGLYKTAYGILGNEHDAADAVQETLLKSYNDVKKLRKPELFKNWLYRILVNRCIDIIRQRKKITPVEKIWLPDAVTEDNDTKLTVAQAVAALDDQHRVVVVLRFFQDMSLKEIASVLDCPVGTVKSRLHRAMQKLKIKLSGETEQGGSNP